MAKLVTLKQLGSMEHYHDLFETFAEYVVRTTIERPMQKEKEDRENILRARATRKVVLTSPFRLLGSHHLGVMLTFSVYKSKLPPSLAEQELIEATVGYLGGAVDVESLMENLLGKPGGN
ncbi:hypothetical protein GOBAR_DD31671 [Gossypium barbadense]|nr:hypothetical protein GOBAR_DD31671 [Gossypium barbadense]